MEEQFGGAKPGRGHRALASLYKSGKIPGIITQNIDNLHQVSGFAGDAARGNRAGPVIAPLADEIARYIVDRRLARPAIVGHSMGGTLAMMIAPQQPGHFAEQLVTANAALARELAAGEKGSLPGLAPEFPAVKGQDLRAFGWGGRSPLSVLLEMLASDRAGAERPT